MANQQPIDHFLRELRNPNGLRRLVELRRRLDPTRQGRRLHKLALGSRSKTFKVYTVEAVEQAIVVKFNPCGERDPFIDDVKKEYRILTKLPRGAAPEPLFCSTADEEAITGTEFMVMTFIDGPNFRVVGEIPEGMVVKVHVTAMKKLAEVHAHVLRDRLVAKHEDTESYWQEVVDSYLQNYRSTVGWLRWLFGAKMFGVDKESCLFSQISRGTKPNSQDRVSVIHGNLDIGNFVFNEEMTEVRAILNFKYEMNGDPIMDVASLLLSFMDRGDYSAKSEMVYHATDKDISEVVEAYRQISIKEFSDEELAFGRAVCCLRHLCIYKRGIYDGFRDHESGVHKEIAEKATIVLDLLHRQGEAAYRAFCS